LNSTPVTGSPVSATEERRTVQTLGDGTMIDNADTNLFYRDSQGRTRIERTIQGKTSIVITDPVARIVARLDPATRTVHKSNMPAAPGPSGYADQLKADIEKIRADVIARDHIAPAPGASDAAITHEDLGTLSQNGVPAQGTRATMTIPAGKIGNNRDIRVVNERWYSNELQMMVKSVNSDPRFGTTTYQLTNILRANPDLGLFQIPPDYTVVEGGGRGAVSKSGR
jgi:hypothetical protein